MFEIEPRLMFVVIVCIISAMILLAMLAANCKDMRSLRDDDAAMQGIFNMGYVSAPPPPKPKDDTSAADIIRDLRSLRCSTENALERAMRLSFDSIKAATLHEIQVISSELDRRNGASLSPIPRNQVVEPALVRSNCINCGAALHPTVDPQYKPFGVNQCEYCSTVNV